MAAAVAMAQGVKITGTLVDRDTKDGVMLATVQMLKADSTYIKGVLSDEKGNFMIEAPGREATVVGQAARVTVKEDTFVYNASAYRTPEGSVVEELVKRLPGAQVSDDGTITINGKEV